MGAESKIEWCHHTFNPWWGCQRVSPGCEHCYAESFAKRVGLKVWGPESAGTPRRFFGDKHWAEPLKWNDRAAKLGVRERVFCASMADVFEDRADLIEPRARLYTLIAQTPSLDWLLLTKRPENIARMLLGARRENVWLGTTTEDQQRADQRLPHLLACAHLAAKTFVSYEPALGPVDFHYALEPSQRDADLRGADSRWNIAPFGVRPDWIIAGGESGSKARPMREEWVRSVRGQCVDAGIAFFYKQKLDGRTKVSLPLLDGERHDAVPA